MSVDEHANSIFRTFFVGNSWSSFDHITVYGIFTLHTIYNIYNIIITFIALNNTIPGHYTRSNIFLVMNFSTYNMMIRITIRFNARRPFVVDNIVIIDIVIIIDITIVAVVNNSSISISLINNMFDIAIPLVKNDNVVRSLRLFVALLVVCPDDNYSISPMSSRPFWFAVAPVYEYLKKDKKIYCYLKWSTNPKL